MKLGITLIICFTVWVCVAGIVDNGITIRIETPDLKPSQFQRLVVELPQVREMLIAKEEYDEQNNTTPVQTVR